MTIPPTCLSLSNVTLLDVGHNHIVNIPKDIRNMTNLQELWINHNPLTDLSLDLTKCKNLKKIDCRFTLVTKVKKEFSTLEKLVELDMEGCPLKENLMHLLNEGFLGLKSYLERKNDKRCMKEQLHNALIDGLYMSTDPEQIFRMVNDTFALVNHEPVEFWKKLVHYAVRI